MGRMEGQTSPVLPAQARLDFIGGREAKRATVGKKKARGHHKALPTRTGVWFLVSIDGTSDHFPPLWRWVFYQELYPTALHHQLPREYFV